jgi:23S rRNA (uracil1939-C5)-methyltransferase
MPLPTEMSTELLVEKFVGEGRSLARLADGRVVLLEGAVPGDRVVLERATVAKGWVKAEAFRLVSASPRRAVPRCPVAAECGGCDWMMVAPAEQRSGKLAMLEEALTRIGKLRLDRPIPFHSDHRMDGYRGRIRLRVHEGRVGFYRRGSHALVEPDRCRVSRPVINLALLTLRALSSQHPGALDAFVWLELREATDGSVSVYLERNAGRLGQAAERFLAVLRERFIVVTGEGEARQEASWQRFQLTPETHLLSPPGTFTQVNWGVNRALVARATQLALEREVRTFLDVFSGAGNFSLPWIARGLRGISIESNPLSVMGARKAARSQGLPADGFKIGDAASFARALSRQGESFDLVFLDPPRAGVKHGLADFAALSRGFIGMCSCNPTTLARDLDTLIGLGCSLEQIEAFDMFPHTHHLETLVFLRTSRPQGSP